MSQPNTRSHSPRRQKWKWMIGAVFLAGMFVIMIRVLLLPVFINSRYLKKKIEDSLQQATSCPVELGQLRLSGIINSVLTLESLRVGNPSGFSKNDFINAESIKLKASWFQLAFGAVHIQILELKRLAVRLERNSSHQLNFQQFSPPHLQQLTSTGHTAALLQANTISSLPTSPVWEVQHYKIEDFTILFAEKENILYSLRQMHIEIDAKIDRANRLVNLKHFIHSNFLDIDGRTEISPTENGLKIIGNGKSQFHQNSIIKDPLKFNYAATIDETKKSFELRQLQIVSTTNNAGIRLMGKIRPPVGKFDVKCWAPLTLFSSLIPILSALPGTKLIGQFETNQSLSFASGKYQLTGKSKIDDVKWMLLSFIPVSLGSIGTENDFLVDLEPFRFFSKLDFQSKFSSFLLQGKLEGKPSRPKIDFKFLWKFGFNAINKHLGPALRFFMPALRLEGEGALTGRLYENITQPKLEILLNLKEVGLSFGTWLQKQIGSTLQSEIKCQWDLMKYFETQNRSQTPKIVQGNWQFRANNLRVAGHWLDDLRGEGIFNTQLFKGSFSGKMENNGKIGLSIQSHIEDQKWVSRLGLALDLPGNVNRRLPWKDSKAGITGGITIDSAFRLHGFPSLSKDILDILEKMDGYGNFRMRSGTLTEITSDKILNKVLLGPVLKRLWPVSKTNALPFDQIHSDFILKNGLLDIPSFMMSRQSQYNLKGRGQINLSQNLINMGFSFQPQPNLFKTYPPKESNALKELPSNLISFQAKGDLFNPRLNYLLPESFLEVFIPKRLKQNTQEPKLTAPDHLPLE